MAIVFSLVLSVVPCLLVGSHWNFYVCVPSAIYHGAAVFVHLAPQKCRKLLLAFVLVSYIVLLGHIYIIIAVLMVVIGHLLISFTLLVFVVVTFYFQCSTFVSCLLWLLYIAFALPMFTGGTGMKDALVEQVQLCRHSILVQYTLP